MMNNSQLHIRTNPPYMGNKYMNELLNAFIIERYETTKADLFSAFIEYSVNKVKRNGHLGFITPFVWMFIESYEDLRKLIIENNNISSLIQLEYNSFEAACVPVATFTLRNSNIDISGEYIDLSNFTGSGNQPIKVLEAINDNVNYRYTKKSRDYGKHISYIIAYWISEKVDSLFRDELKLDNIAKARQGVKTLDNDRFLKLWYEVNNKSIGMGIKSLEEARDSSFKWFPYNKGGKYRKWYGNNEYVVNWENDGFEMKQFAEFKYKNYTRTITNISYFFKRGLTWSTISSNSISLRAFNEGFIFDSKGSCMFFDDYNKEIYILGILNSKIANELLKILSPNLDFNVGALSKLPIIINEEYFKDVNKYVINNIELSKEEWDFYETSWDFKIHPLIKHNRNGIIKDCFSAWETYYLDLYNKVKSNEENINRNLIEIYNLQEEMESDIDDQSITIGKANKKTDIKSFISYSVGCMLGRYSLDEEGLIYAGGGFDSSKYNTFRVDEDNIIPILSENYFEDDIVSKFVEFVKVTFGEETLSENLEYIAETLGKKSNETAKETIRRYFLTDFYKDHLQTYKNRPLYWMFTSGKQKAFNCLIYMHRYDKTTLSRIRTDYLHELQDRLDTERKALIDVVEGDYSTKEKSEAKKKLTPIDKQIDELKKYDEVLHHMADMQIEIDLDDGVKVNYEKFKGLLAKI